MEREPRQPGHRGTRSAAQHLPCEVSFLPPLIRILGSKGMVGSAGLTTTHPHDSESFRFSSDFPIRLG